MDPKQEDELRSLDAQIVRLQKSTRTTIPALLPLHDVMRHRFRWYYNWSCFKWSKYVHVLILIGFLFFIGGYFYKIGFTHPTPAMAASAGINPASDELTQMNVYPAEAHYLAVSDVNDATYVYNNVADSNEKYGTASIANVFKITSVAVTTHAVYTSTLGYNPGYRMWHTVYVGGVDRGGQTFVPTSAWADYTNTWNGTWYAASKAMSLVAMTCDSAYCGAGPWAEQYTQYVSKMSATVTYEQGPTGATNVNVSDHSQTISWTDNSTTETGNNIYKSSVLDTSTGVTTSYTYPNNLTANTSYTLGVAAKDATGVSDIANAAALTTPTNDQTRYRIGANDGTLPTDHTWLAAENIAPNVDKGTLVRVRIQVKNSGGAVTQTPRLYSSTAPTSGYAVITATCSNAVCIAAGTALDGASFAPGLNTPGGTGTNGLYEETGSDTNSGISLPNLYYTEYEWSVQLTTAATVGQSYYFRAYFNNSDTFQAYTYNAQITATLATPTSPYISGVTTSAMVLNWTDITGEDDYHIKKSTDGVTYSEVGTAAQNATSYSGAGTTGLTENTRYWFQVLSHATGYSNPATSQAITKTTHLLPASEANKTLRVLANDTKLPGEDGEVATITAAGTNSSYYDAGTGKLFTTDNSTDGRLEKVAASTTLGNPVPGSAVRVEESRTNLILNSSFETGTLDNWTNPSGFTKASDKAMHGTYSIKAANLGAGGYAAYQSVTVSASTKYTLSGWIYETNASGHEAYFDALQDDGSTTYCQAHVGVFSAWTYTSCSFTTTASAAITYIRMVGYGNAGSNIYWFDAVQLEAGAFATSYIPTTTAAATRNGENIQYANTGNLTTGSGTISAWVKPEWASTDTNTRGNDYYGTIFESGYGTANSLLFTFFTRNNTASNNLAIFQQGGTFDYTTCLPSFAANSWHHAALTYATGQPLKIYWDGALCTSTPGNANNVPTTGNMTLGKYYAYANPNSYFNGLISDFTIFNTTLTADQVTGLYYQNGPTNVTMDTPTNDGTNGGLTAHWNDNSSNETNFTLQRAQTATCAGAGYGSDTTANANDTSKAITGLSTNLQYCYQLKGTVSSHNSPYSVSSAAKYTGAAIPGAPTVAAISWNASDGNALSIVTAAGSNPAATEFALACDATGTNWLNASNGSCDAIADDTNHWKTKAGWETGTVNYLKNLTADTNYTLVTRSRNGDKVNTSNSSSTGPTRTAPAQPTNTGQTHNSITGHTANDASSITWAWNQNGVAPDGYKVYEYSSSTCQTGQTAKVTVTGSPPAGFGTESTGLAANTSYPRCIQAYRGTITGQPSTNFSAYTAIEEPSNIDFDTTNNSSLAMSSNAATLTNLNLGQSGVTFTFNDGSYTNKGTGGTSSAKLNTDTYTDSGLQPNQQYCYRVQAFNGDNDGSPASGTVPAAGDGACKYTKVNELSTGPTITAQSWDASNGNWVSVIAAANSNPSHTEFAIACNTAGTSWLDGSDGTCDSYTRDTLPSSGPTETNYWKIKTDWETGTNRLKSLSADTNITLVAMARNIDETKTDANSSSSNTVMTAPAQPTGIAHTGHNNSTTQIVWNFADNAVALDGYHLLNNSDEQIETSATSDFIQTHSTPSVGLSANTQYTVKARGYRGAITGQPTGTTQAYTSIETPTGITATADSTSQISLVATGTLSNLAAGSSGLQFGEIQGSPGGGGQGCFTGWTKTNSCADTGLNANTMYRYNVTARNGDSDPSDTYSFQQRYTLIETPTGITTDPAFTNPITPNSLKLKVNGTLTNLSVGSSGIRLTETSGNTGGGGEVCFTSDCQTTSLTDTNLVHGTAYKYTVHALNAEGVPTGETTEATFLTTTGTELLFKLPNQTIGEDADHKLTKSGVPSSRTAGVAFTVPVYAADNNLFRDLSSTDLVTLSTTAGAASMPPAAALTNGLKDNFSVTYNIVGTYTIHGAGSGGDSDQFVVGPALCSPDSPVSVNPASLLVNQTSTITITLQDTLGNKLPGHTVSANSSEGGDGISFSAAQTDANGQIMVYVTSSQPHTSTITLADTTDAITLSTKPQITFNLPAVENPTNFTANAVASACAGNPRTCTVKIELAWTNPATFNQINIYRSEALGVRGDRIASTAGNSYTDNDVQAGVSYFYTLEAEDNAVPPNKSSGTAQVSARGVCDCGDNQAPTAPTNLRATKIKDTSISIAWDPSTDDIGVAGYQIFNPDTGIMTGVTSDTKYDFENLQPDTTYKFHVRAYDADNNFSEFSEILTVRTLQGKKPEVVEVHLVLSNVPEEINAGESFPGPVRVIAADAGGKIITDYHKAVYFESTDKAAKFPYAKDSPYTYTSYDAGVHQFDGNGFVLKTSGNQKLIASDFEASTSADIKVIAGISITNATEKIRDFIAKPETVNKANTAVVTTTTAILLAPVLANALISFSSLLPQLLYWLIQILQFLGLRKKAKPWGVVFNAETGQPLSLAIVRIYETKYNRILERAVTDNQGRYGFLAKPGEFYITCSKAGYIFPSKEKKSTFYEKIYTGGNFKITDKNQSIAFNIPLDPTAGSKQLINFWIWITRINKLLQKLRVPFLILGIIFAIIMMIISFNMLYILSLIFYALIGTLEILRSKKARPYGVVTDVYSHPMGLTIVRIYKKNNNQLIETDVSDSQGRFKFLVATGIYYITATKPGHIDFKSHLMYLEKEKTLVSTTIKLKKIEK